MVGSGREASSSGRRLRGRKVPLAVKVRHRARRSAMVICATAVRGCSRSMQQEV